MREFSLDAVAGSFQLLYPPVTTGVQPFANKLNELLPIEENLRFQKLADLFCSFGRPDETGVRHGPLDEGNPLLSA